MLANLEKKNRINLERQPRTSSDAFHDTYGIKYDTVRATSQEYYIENRKN